MGNYSKLVGALVGALASIGIGFGLPADLLGPEIQAGLSVIIVGLFTYFFPANVIS